MSGKFRLLFATSMALVAATSVRADTFLWNNVAGGSFETPSNWKAITFGHDGDGNWEISSEDVAIRCPGAGDDVYFSGGPVTVTLAGNREVATINNLSATYWSKYGNPTDQIVFDLQGYTLDITSRSEVFTMYGDNSSIIYSNGTLRCEAPLAHAGGGDQWRIGDTTGFGIGITWGENWAVGEPWSDWIPHIGLTLSDVDATISALWLQGNLANFTANGGATIAMPGDVSVNRGGGDTFILSGEGTEFSCRTFATSGHSQTNIVEDGAVLIAGAIANGWYGAWSDTLKQVTFHVRDGAKIVLTNATSNIPYEGGEADGGEGCVYYDFRETCNHLVNVEGEGSEIRFDQVGGWRYPQFSIAGRLGTTNCFLRVADGALVHGSDTSSIVIGGAPQVTDNGVIIDDATVSVGHFLCGTEWANWDFGQGYMGQSSNAILRVSGPGALLEIRASGASGNENNGLASTFSFNYNAHLEIEIPADGFDQTPIQVLHDRMFSKASEIPGYNTPGCHLTLQALDWTRRHPGTRQVLIETASDSTDAFQTLIDNAAFPDVAGTTYLGMLSIEGNGTRLVYSCPSATGTTLMVF